MAKKRPSWKSVEGHPRIHKRGNEYGIKYQKATGIYGKKKTSWETKIPTLREAIARDKEIQQRQAPGQKTYSEQTFGHFLKNKFTKIHFSEIRKNTQITYTATINQLLPLLGEKKIREVDINDVYFFRENLISRKSSISTVNIYLATLHVIFEKAVEWGDVVENPMPKKYKLKKQRKEKRELNPDELKEIIERLDKENEKRMCYVSLFSGMRAGEIAGLKWADVDFEKNTIRVQRQITRWGEETTTKTETGVYANFEMIPELAEKLRECRESCQDEELYVFPGMNGKDVSLIIVLYKRRCIYNGIDPLLSKGQGFHHFRHSFGSLLYQKTKNIAYVSKMMRHSSVTITMNEYVHLIQGDVLNYTESIRFYE